MSLQLMVLLFAVVAAMSLALAFGPGDREDADTKHTRRYDIPPVVQP